MGKQGPCYHCGVTSTPLWRNGPPEKPVLCNACGSRWRTKGTLANYAPLHSRHDSDEYNDRRLSRPNTLSLKIGEQKLKKRKVSFQNYNRSCLESIDEEEEEDDDSNISSYGSALSNTELQFGSADDRDFTGPVKSTMWESQIPSKKRSVVNHTNSSPVQKFIKDLHAILHEQQQSSYHCEEDLVSVEIGHGSMLIKHPTSFASEEDSESSSVSFENKSCALNEIYSCNGSQRDHFKNDSMQDSKSPKQTPGKETNGTHKKDLIKCGLRSNFCDQDLLLDVPMNCCFPEAELLLPPSTSHLI